MAKDYGETIKPIKEINLYNSDSDFGTKISICVI